MNSSERGCPAGYDAAHCKIYNDTNSARAQHGLPALKVSPNCDDLAQAHAEDMSNTGDLYHTSPTYGTFSKRLKAFSVPGSWHAENVYWSSKGLSASSGAVKSWMNSPGHKKNILNPKATAIGIGTSQGYFAQCFSNE